MITAHVETIVKKKPAPKATSAKVKPKAKATARLTAKAKLAKMIHTAAKSKPIPKAKSDQPRKASGSETFMLKAGMIRKTDVALIFGVSIPTIDRWIRRRVIRGGVRLGASRFWKESDVLADVTTHLANQQQDSVGTTKRRAPKKAKA